MNRDQLVDIFERMTPDAAQKSRMREKILSHMQTNAHVKRPPRRRRAWMAVPAVCLGLALLLLAVVPFGGETSAYAIHIIEKDGAIFRLSDNRKSADDYGTFVSNVDARPGLEFYIDGDNITKIEISTKNEYIYAVDWTKTQHEKYWNVEYYQHFDEERQISVADFSLLYDKNVTMTFDEGFSDYDKIWYRWTAWNMYKWAAEDHFSRFLGAGQVSGNLSEREKSELAAGDDGSGTGHIQLDDYPDHLKEDTITITITDRQGKRTTKVISVKVSNNEQRQTVVTARLIG
ncbi:hypothetical protein ABEV74_07270 [Paenibacillus cisolokensis]|uniref:hypothetical protein n=1 Tax=Paenibacillus cisolokensis TaxID=1658519 RepID=UPI003D2B232F